MPLDDGYLRAAPGPIESADWYVDPAGGNDANSGLSESRPLRTFEAWKKRACKGGHTWDPLGFPILHVMSDCSESFSLNITGATSVRDGTIRGRQTVVATVTVAGAGQLVGSTSTYATLTVAGMTWTPHIGRRVRLKDSGDAWQPGTHAIIRADLGSGVALVTPWVDGGGAATAPAVGSEVEIYTVPSVSGQWGIHVDSAVHYLADLDIIGNANFSSVYLSGGCFLQVHAVQCLFGYSLEIMDGRAELYGCFAASGGHIRTQGGQLYTRGGGASGSASRLYAIGGYIDAAAMYLENGAFLNVEGGASMLISGDIGIRDSAIRAIAVTDGLIQLSGKVFSTGHTATNGIEVEAGQVLLVAPGKLPSLATPTAFANVGGTTRTAAQLASSYVNTTNNASVVYKVF